MTTPTEHTEAALAQINPMLTYGHRSLFTLARMQGQALKAGLRYQIEALSFMKHRCEQDLKLVEDILGSDDFNDAFDVCANFWQNARLEYSREAAKVTGIGSQVVSDAAKELRKEAEAATAEMAAQTVAA